MVERRLTVERLRVRIPAGTVGDFSSPELRLRAYSYSVSIPPPRYRSGTRKTPSFRQKCRWQVISKQAHTLDPTESVWADYAAVQAWRGKLSGNELTRNSSGDDQPQSSQLAEPLWTDPGLMNGISVRDLIFT